MPKRTKKNRYMKKGGDIIGTPPPTAQGYPSTPTPAAPSTFSSWFTGATTAMKKAASSVGSVASSAASSVGSAASSATNALQKTVSPSTGGKRRRKGGEMLAMPIQTAQPQVWVGGKTRKRCCQKRHKHTKSCKSQTYKKKVTEKTVLENRNFHLVKV